MLDFKYLYVICIILGVIIGASVQQLRVTAVTQDFTKYKQEIKQTSQDYQDTILAQREISSKEYYRFTKQLESEINKHEIYVSCVAAGKCGARLCPTDNLSQTFQTQPNLNGESSNPILIAGGVTDEVVNDCARTTLQLNQLQKEILNQPGYNDGDK